MKNRDSTGGLWSRIAAMLGMGSRSAPPSAPSPRRPAPPSAPVAAGLENFVLRMPKVEVHVHLEGSARPASLLSLAKQNGVGLPAEDEAGIRRWLRFRDFAHFVEIYKTASGCLKRPEDFRVLVADLMAEQAIQNVVYTEAHFTIATHAANGVDPEAVRRVLAEAVREGEEHHGARLKLIPDIIRDDGEELADLTLDWALAGRREGLTVALGITGTETLANEPYRRHFEAARKGGLATTAHAGEHGGPESIRSVLEVIEAGRIDHGVRSLEDASLLAELVEKGMPLTVCPTSNVLLGVAADYESHPFDRLYRSGANVSVNTDGSQTFGTNLTREYLNLHRLFGYGAAELAGLSLAGLRQAFLSDVEKARLEEEFRQSFRELGEKYLGGAVEPAAGPSSL